MNRKPIKKIKTPFIGKSSDACSLKIRCKTISTCSQSIAYTSGVGLEMILINGFFDSA